MRVYLSVWPLSQCCVSFGQLIRWLSRVKNSVRVLQCSIPPRLQINLSLFSCREEAKEPESWSTLSHTVHSGDYSVKHHRGLNVYMLTAEAKEGTAASLESDIRHLQMHMQSHQHMVRKRMRWRERSRAGWFLPSTQPIPWGGLPT